MNNEKDKINPIYYIIIAVSAIAVISAVVIGIRGMSGKKDRKTAVAASPDFTITASAVMTHKPAPAQSPAKIPAATAAPASTAKPGYPVLQKLVYGDGNFLTYNYEGNTITAQDQYGRLYFTLEYDQNGNKIRKTRYQEAGTKNSYFQSSYDAKGKLIQTIQYRASENLHLYTTYEYDAQGNITKTLKSVDDPSQSKFEYDKNGRQTKQITGTDEYYFDENANLTMAKASQDVDGSYNIQYEYDAQNHLVRMEYGKYDMSRGRIMPETTEIYDINGNLIQSMTYYLTKEDTVTTYEYDENKKWTAAETVKHFTNESKYIEFKLTQVSDISYSILCDKNGNIIPAYTYGEIDGGVTLIYHGKEEFVGTHYEDKYDDSGNVVLRTYYYDNGYTFFSIKYEYDQSNRKIKEYHNTYECCGGSYNMLTLNYEYDDSGNLYRMLDRTLDNAEYIFDKNGRVIQYTQPDGDIFSSIQIEYNQDGEISEKRVNYINNNNVSAIIYKYDTDGNELTHTFYTVNSNSVYNNKGQKIKEASYAADQTLTSATQYQYEQSGRLIKKITYDKSGAVLSTIDYNFDENNNAAGFSEYDATGNIIGSDKSAAIVTEYDDKGYLNKIEGIDSEMNAVKGEFILVVESVYKIFAMCDPLDLLP